MGQMNPHLRDIKEYNHKLWDHLFIMSNFKLDVDSPYPLPEIEKIEERPEKMPYPNNKILFSFYGSNVQNMIEIAIEMEDEMKKKVLIGMIANHMKKCYLLFNKDSVDEKTIIIHLKKLSNNKLSLPDNFTFIEDHVILKGRKNKYNSKKKFKKRR